MGKIDRGDFKGAYSAPQQLVIDDIWQIMTAPLGGAIIGQKNLETPFPFDGTQVTLDGKQDPRLTAQDRSSNRYQLPNILCLNESTQ
jgi:hypothetical protein